MLKKISLLLLIVFTCKMEPQTTGNPMGNKNSIPSPHIHVKIDVKELNNNELPHDITYQGNLITAKKWNDKRGENLLIIYTNGPFLEKEIEETDGEKYVSFYAEKYLIHHDKSEKIWKVYDFVRHCAYDMWIGLSSPESVYITDLDNNEITETTLVYYLTCRSDVSPSRMKLIMREGRNKYALRGNTMIKSRVGDINTDTFEPDLSKIKVKDTESYEGFLQTLGRYENENDFQTAHSKFLDFAREKWKENMIEETMRQF